MKKIIKKPLFWVIIIAIIVIVVMGIVGFKITYNPNLDNNWDAISACATWVGVVVSGLAIYYAIKVPKTIANRQDKIALFEKRLECYIAIQRVIAFTESIENVKDPQVIKNRFLSTIMYTNREINDFKDNNMIICINDLAEMILTGHFLFNNYNYKLLMKLVESIMEILGIFENKEFEVIGISKEGLKKIDEMLKLSQDFKENYLYSLEEELILK